MRIYILKAYAVIPGAPVASYENEETGKVFAREEDAERWANWWRFDQGRRDTTVEDAYIECPMVDGSVVYPENIIR